MRCPNKAPPISNIQHPTSNQAHRHTTARQTDSDIASPPMSPPHPHHHHLLGGGRGLEGGGLLLEGGSEVEGSSRDHMAMSPSSSYSNVTTGNLTPGIGLRTTRCEFRRRWCGRTGSFVLCIIIGPSWWTFFPDLDCLHLNWPHLSTPHASTPNKGHHWDQRL